MAQTQAVSCLSSVQVIRRCQVTTSLFFHGSIGPIVILVSISGILCGAASGLRIRFQVWARQVTSCQFRFSFGPRWMVPLRVRFVSAASNSIIRVRFHLPAFGLKLIWTAVSLFTWFHNQTCFIATTATYAFSTYGFRCCMKFVEFIKTGTYIWYTSGWVGGRLCAGLSGFFFR
jgi:hypothetical protein